MGKTKIVVLQLKELIYTAIFIGLGILLLVLLVYMFYPKDEDNATASAEYKPGVYTSQLTLGESTLNIEVSVDQKHVNSVSVTNLDESMSTMYPLISPSVENLESQLKKDVPVDDVVLTEDSRYTEILLLDGIKDCLAQATSQK